MNLTNENLESRAAVPNAPQVRPSSVVSTDKMMVSQAA